MNIRYTDLRFDTLTNQTKSYTNIKSMQVFNKGIGGAGSDVTITNRLGETRLVPYNIPFNIPVEQNLWSELSVIVPADTTAEVTYYV